VFSTFNLNKDPSCSSYMPYDDVSYPKLRHSKMSAGNNTDELGMEVPPPGGTNDKNPQAFAELDSMWMVGFLHHNKKMKDEEQSKELEPFLRLPGSTVLPEAEKEMRKVAERNLKGRIEKLGLEPRFDEGDKKGGRSDNRSKMSDEERMRLDELGDLLVKKRKRAKNPGMALYRQANRKINRVLMEKKPLRHPPSMKSGLMEKMFEVERRETQAANIIQGFWHKYLIVKRLRDNFQKGKKIKVIQALVRGMITRKWLALWYKNRFLMIVQWQARIRRYIITAKDRKAKARDWEASIKCQKCARMFIEKCKAKRRQLELATQRIQCMWRGIIARARCDKMWLDKQVTVLQAFARFAMAKGKFDEEKEEMYEAACLIERCYRGYYGRRRKNELLYERETLARTNQTRLFASDEQYWSDHVKLLQKRLKKLNLEEKNTELKKNCQDMFAYVEEQEFAYLELVRQRDAVSPRAIEQGWVEELNTNIRDHRTWITKYKLECLFDTGLEQRGVEEEYERRMLEINLAKKKHAFYAKWREEELEQIWARQQQLVYEMEDIWNRQKVADEKRKWNVKFFKPSGKPDKLRRPGRPWEPGAYAGADKATFCGGTANLFAYNSDAEKLRVGSNESIARLMQKLQLQSYHNQVQQYEALLKPLASNMQSAMHGGKDQVAIDEGTLEEMNIQKSGETPRPDTPPQDKIPQPELYENPEDDPYEDPFFKTDEEKKDAADGKMVQFKTAEERAAQRRADKRRSKYRKPVSVLPWALLDELQAEKDKFTQEKALAKLQNMKEMNEKESKAKALKN